MTTSMRSPTRFGGMLALAATVAMPVLAVPAFAQTAPNPAAKAPMGTNAMPQGVTSTTTVTGKTRSADRATKIIGSDVMNDNKETIGTINDLLITQGEKVPTAILSIGGFLGIGTRYVAVPFSDLKMSNNGVIMPGATKASLKALPEFKYDND